MSDVYDETMRVYSRFVADLLRSGYREVYALPPHSGGPYAYSIFKHGIEGHTVKVEWFGLSQRVVISYGDQEDIAA